MSYYILPKSNNNIVINPKSTSHVPQPYISQSLFTYYNECKNIINKLCTPDSEYNTFSEIIKITNPHEYIFSKVPGSKFSVSKLKTKTNMYYDLLEMNATINLFDNITNAVGSLTNQPIKLLHIGSNCDDSIRCISIMREPHTLDTNISFPEINNDLYKTIHESKFDFIFYEMDHNLFSNNKLYIVQLIKFIMLILKNQSSNGNCVIKINSSVYKPVVDALYIFSSLFEKVYIIKPNTNNIMTFDKYIVCKGFITNDTRNDFHKTNYFNMYSFLRHLKPEQYISSIVNVDVVIPSYFVNKIDDANIIIGQQQLEMFDQLINILNNKNKHDKIELMKKSNIQKSVTWCEKYKIPYNKFSEKTNIFLPLEDKLDENVTSTSKI